MLPRPDQAPTSFQMTTSRAGGFEGACERQAATAMLAATTAAATTIQRFTPSCYRSVRALIECLFHPLVETLQHPMAMTAGMQLQIVGLQPHLLGRLP
jgi:hypothetical protein